MFYRLSADLVVVVHFGFILFAVFGGLLVLRWRRWVWVHVPAALWAILIAWAGWICPLTPLENWFRERGSALPYHSSFVEQYLLPLVYPTLLTRRVQIVLALSLLGINLGIYVCVLCRRAKARC